jgi:hypothetical protein
MVRLIAAQHYFVRRVARGAVSWNEVGSVTAGRSALSPRVTCKACQRRTGTALHFGATYLKERVRLEGERKIYEREADSGYRIRFHFCPNCGSTTYWEGDRILPSAELP